MNLFLRTSGHKPRLTGTKRGYSWWPCDRRPWQRKSGRIESTEAVQPKRFAFGQAQNAWEAFVEQVAWAGWIGPDGRLTPGALPRRDTAMLRSAAEDRRCCVKAYCGTCRALLAVVARGRVLCVVSVYGRCALPVEGTRPILAGCRCAEPFAFDGAELRWAAESAPSEGFVNVQDPGPLAWIDSFSG